MPPTPPDSPEDAPRPPIKLGQARFERLNGADDLPRAAAKDVLAAANLTPPPKEPPVRTAGELRAAAQRRQWARTRLLVGIVLGVGGGWLVWHLLRWLLGLG